MTLQIIEDQKKFDDHQAEFLRALVATFKDSLEQADVSISEDDIFNLTSILTFNVSALLDASVSAGSLEDSTTPCLLFRDGQQSETLVASTVGSYLHEISEGVVEASFEDVSIQESEAVSEATDYDGLDGDCQFFLKSPSAEIELWLFPKADEEDAMDSLVSALFDAKTVSRLFAEDFLAGVESIEVIRHDGEKTSERKTVAGWQEAKANGVDGVCELLTRVVN